MGSQPCRRCQEEVAAGASHCAQCGAAVLGKYDELPGWNRISILSYLALLCPPLAILRIWLGNLFVPHHGYALPPEFSHKLSWTMAIIAVWGTVAVLFLQLGAARDDGANLRAGQAEHSVAAL